MTRFKSGMDSDSYSRQITGRPEAMCYREMIEDTRERSRDSNLGLLLVKVLQEKLR